MGNRDARYMIEGTVEFDEGYFTKTSSDIDIANHVETHISYKSNQQTTTKVLKWVHSYQQCK